MLLTTTILKLAASVACAGPASAYMPIGCWADNSYRSLQDNFLQSADMSTEVCESFCKGYPIFGTENANQCFCGKQLYAGAPFADPSWVGCTQKCAGNANQICGGPWGMNLYVH